MLDSLESSNLGVWLGNINVAVSGVADDIYLMSDKQTKLQEEINIAKHYGDLYRLTYGASKTKITVIGSDIDVKYFEDTKPWIMDGNHLDVAKDNEHLGQIVSNFDQERKNVDLRLQKGRTSLYSFLGSGFAHKSHLSPVLKIHIYRTYVCPIIRSGLSTFVLRNHLIEPLVIFQRKTLKSILKLSMTAPTPSIHFLTGELPLEGKIHKDIFSLFYSIWSNPDTKIYSIVKYLLENNCQNSRTWSQHLRYLSEIYGLEDPLVCLQHDPPTRSDYKELVNTKITAHFEMKLRKNAAENSLMKYFNVTTLNLRGRHHVAISELSTSRSVLLARPHIKLLSGNYLTYGIRAQQNGGSPTCRICTSEESKTIRHFISQCSALHDTRERFILEYKELCKETVNDINFDLILKMMNNFASSFLTQQV